jgi:hypothetical protein
MLAVTEHAGVKPICVHQRASVLRPRWLFLALPHAALSRPGEARHGTPSGPGTMCLTLHGVLSTMGRIDPIRSGQRWCVLVHGVLVAEARIDPILGGQRRPRSGE